MRVEVREKCESYLKIKVGRDDLAALSLIWLSTLCTQILIYSV